MKAWRHHEHIGGEGSLTQQVINQLQQCLETSPGLHLGLLICQKMLYLKYVGNHDLS